MKETVLLKCFNGYSPMAPKAKLNATKGTGILTRKQILLRLPVALAQVQAGNSSEIC